jgi:hypothetical protein
MMRARVLLYGHCLVGFACIGLAAFALERQAEFGGRFHRRLEVFFAHPVVAGAYLACALSCFAFPAGVAFAAVGRTSAWRWAPAVAVSVVLGLMQYFALVMVYPIRD